MDGDVSRGNEWPGLTKTLVEARECICNTPTIAFIQGGESFCLRCFYRTAFEDGWQTSVENKRRIRERDEEGERTYRTIKDGTAALGGL